MAKNTAELQNEENKEVSTEDLDFYNSLALGDLCLFAGYSEEVDEPTFVEGQKLKLFNVDPNGSKIFRAINEETGEFVGDTVEILFEGEVKRVSVATDATEEDETVGLFNRHNKKKEEQAEAEVSTETEALTPAEQVEASHIEAEPEAEPEAAPEVEPEVEPETAPEAELNAEPEAEPEVEPEAEPEVEPEAAPETAPEAAPEAELLSDVAAEQDTELKAAETELGINAVPGNLPRSALVRAALSGVKDKSGDIGQTALAAARDLVKRIDENYFTLGGILSFVKETGAYKAAGYVGKRGFAQYCQIELNTDYRKAQYLIRIYDEAQNAGIDETRLSQVGWSKAKEIVRIGKDAPDVLARDFDELLDYAENHNRNDLISHITTNYENVKTREANANEKVKGSTFVFKLVGEQASACESAIDSAKTITGSKDMNEAFAYILNDWVMMTEGAKISREDAIGVIENRFNIKLAVTEDYNDTEAGQVENEEETQEATA